MAHDPDTEGRWQVDDDSTCYAGAALTEFRQAHKTPPPGALISIQLAPEGGAAGFDPAKAAAEVAERDSRLAAMTDN